MTQMGYDSSIETADSILREVDFGRKGAIEFQEYLDVSSLTLLRNKLISRSLRVLKSYSSSPLSPIWRSLTRRARSRADRWVHTRSRVVRSGKSAERYRLRGVAVVPDEP